MCGEFAAVFGCGQQLPAPRVPAAIGRRPAALLLPRDVRAA